MTPIYCTEAVCDICGDRVETVTTTTCEACGKVLCPECQEIVGELVLCPDCAPADVATKEATE